MTKRDEAEGILLADVGGTNVRFAVLRGGKLGSVAYMAVTEHQQFADGVAAFMAAQADAHTIRHALFDAAGLVENGRCALTNNAWVVDAAELAARFGFAGIHIVNDFEAVAWSLPLMTADDLRMIGGRTPKPGAPMVVLGPGTGLGVAAYIPGNGGSVVRGEGGHVTMPSSDAREDAIIARLRQKLGHVSAERVVSGSGLENIYWAIAALERQVVPERNAAAITQAAVAGTCADQPRRARYFLRAAGRVRRQLRPQFRRAGRRLHRRRYCAAPSRLSAAIKVSVPLRGEGADESLSRGDSGLSDLARGSGVHRLAMAGPAAAVGFIRLRSRRLATCRRS